MAWQNIFISYIQLCFVVEYLFCVFKLYFITQLFIHYTNYFCTKFLWSRYFFLADQAYTNSNIGSSNVRKLSHNKLVCTNYKEKFNIKLSTISFFKGKNEIEHPFVVRMFNLAAFMKKWKVKNFWGMFSRSLLTLNVHFHVVHV